ncbi:MAG: hypothetical protein J6K13_06030 [Clostridia bacterium]|nr:hypothetical protein [Clostridia bacterium]
MSDQFSIESMTKDMTEFLSSAKCSNFTKCAELYSKIVVLDSSLQPKAFEISVNLFDCIDSNDSESIAASPYESHRESLEKQYGNVVNSFIEFFTKQNELTETFYGQMWSTIQNDVFFPDVSAKIFAYYYIAIDKRIPYFKLSSGYPMTNESYRKLRNKYASTLRKVKYILYAEVEQKTERASLLLEEMGIPMPEIGAEIGVVDHYEKQLMILVEIIDNARHARIPIDRIISRIASITEG